MATADISSQEADITVWGPTQSGKDWLFRAFAKELDFFNENPRGFHFELLRQAPGEAAPALVESSDMIPSGLKGTMEAEDYQFIFRRVALQKDDAHKLSSHNHRINIHNNMGSELVRALTRPKSFEQAFIPLINSRYILIMLDPSFSKGQSQSSRPDKKQGKDSDSSDYSLDDNDNLEAIPMLLESDHQSNDGVELIKPNLTPDEYLKILKNLLRVLSENNNTPKRHLAVCITKMDQLKVSGADHWGLLARIFGNEIRKLFENYRTIFDIEVFATSAAGYFIDDSGSRRANIAVNDRLESYIVDTREWNPINCAAPFFWMFQHREIERIRSSSNFLNKDSNLDRYIPYPRPRHI